MLEANKKAWFDKIFYIYNKNLLRRRFNSFLVSGIENLSQRNKEIPTLIYSNHSSWWDGLVLYHIGKQINLDHYVMMEEKQLVNLPLFRKLGAFSVVRENPREAIKSINYTVKILKEKSDRAVWIFPQGEIQPNDTRPINFFNGLTKIISKLETAQVICAAMRFEFLGEYKPNIFVKFTKPELIEDLKKNEARVLTNKFSKKLAGNLDSIKKQILNQNHSEFSNII